MRLMSEWTAPGGPEPERERPRYGELAPEGWTPPAQDPGNPHAPVPPVTPAPYGSPGPGASAWTPPPRPGLIPLRPLTLGDVLAASFQVIRRNPRPTFGFALLVQVVVTAVVGSGTGWLAWVLYGRVLSAAEADRETVAAGSVLLFVIAAFVAWLVSSALSSIVQAVVSLDVARATLGETPRLKELWRAARGRFGAIVSWTLLVSLGAAIAVAAVAGVVVAFTPIGPLGIVVGLVVGFVIGLGVLCLCVWLWVRLVHVPTLLVVERLTVRRAVRRSWSLTTGRWWRTFGIVLLVYAIVIVASEVISSPVSFIGGIVGGVVNPNGTEDVADAWTIGLLVVSAAIGTVFGAVGAVAEAAAPALLYLDARMRKEGLDLELQRHVEERAAGRDVPDPYRRD